MATFADFVQTELPLRPFVRTDGTAGQTLVRSNNPLAPRELVWTDAVSGSAGESAYQIAVTLGFSGTQADWLASLGGEKGATGDQGIQGLQGLQGTQGEQGIQGTQGLKGDTGLAGSAYDIAVLLGFSGTQTEWIASLVGAKGDTGAKGEKGDTGVVDPTLLNNEITRATAAEQSLQNALNLVAADVQLLKTNESGEIVGITQAALDAAIAAEAAIRAKNDSDLAGLIASIPSGVKGDTGASAFQIAQLLGYIGTEGQWINSLVGASGKDGKDGVDGVSGADGKSAYQLATLNGFVGSETQWLLSLKGADSTGTSIVVQTPLVGIAPNAIELVDTIDFTKYSEAVWDIVIQTYTKLRRFTVASIYNKVTSKLSYTTYGIMGDPINNKMSIGFDGATTSLNLYIQNKDIDPFVVSCLRYPVKSV
jgi:hypothetical protein